MPTPSPPTAESAADEATIAAAIASLDADIAHMRGLTRQTDAKTGASLAVVGLFTAAATTVMPRLDGAAFVLAVIALVLVVLAGFDLGAVVIPRSRRYHKRTPSQMVAVAFRRVAEPQQVLDDHAAECCALTAVIFAKNRTVQIALALLGAAVALAAVATVVVTVTAFA